MSGSFCTLLLFAVLLVLSCKANKIECSVAETYAVEVIRSVDDADAPGLGPRMSSAALSGVKVQLRYTTRGNTRGFMTIIWRLASLWSSGGPGLIALWVEFSDEVRSAICGDDLAVSMQCHATVDSALQLLSYWTYLDPITWMQWCLFGGPSVVDVRDRLLEAAERQSSRRPKDDIYASGVDGVGSVTANHPDPAVRMPLEMKAQDLLQHTVCTFLDGYSLCLAAEKITRQFWRRHPSWHSLRSKRQSYEKPDYFSIRLNDTAFQGLDKEVQKEFVAEWSPALPVRCGVHRVLSRHSAPDEGRGSELFVASPESSRGSQRFACGTVRERLDQIPAYGSSPLLSHTTAPKPSFVVLWASRVFRSIRKFFFAPFSSDSAAIIAGESRAALPTFGEELHIDVDLRLLELVESLLPGTISPAHRETLKTARPTTPEGVTTAPLDRRSADAGLSLESLTLAYVALRETLPSEIRTSLEQCRRMPEPEPVSSHSEKESDDSTWVEPDDRELLKALDTAFHRAVLEHVDGRSDGGLSCATSRSSVRDTPKGKDCTVDGLLIQVRRAILQMRTMNIERL